MLRKIVATAMTLVFVHTSIAQGSAAFSSYINYYRGMILNNAATSYDQVSLPVFTFEEEDLKPNKIGEINTHCFTQTGKCVVTGVYSNFATVFVSDDESITNINLSKLPITPHTVVARVDSATLSKMMAISSTRYEWGQDNDVDDKILSCGISTVGCLGGIALSASGIAAILALAACTNAAKDCANTSRAMNKSEKDLKDKEAAAQAGSSPVGGGVGEGGRDPLEVIHQPLDRPLKVRAAL